MSELSRKKYYSKLLLFGEYTIINGGHALAIPFEKYFGQWQLGDEGQNLNAFFEFLRNMEDAQHDLLVKAASKGMYFDSSIPSGYGCGSSGALTAAVYDQFFTHKQFDVTNLKQKLASIESFFHGKSSGLDPLVSYLNRAIFYSKDKIEVLDLPNHRDLFFLLDSGIERTTSKWVDVFLKKKERSQAFNEQLDILNTYNEKAISAYILNDGANLFECVKHISLLQRNHFEEMIPENIKKEWDKGIDSEDYYLKLSGAGGGGFFLGFHNPAKS